MTAYSVVIPTHDRLDVLPEVIAAVEAQAGAPDFELVVVDDGSGDGTGEWLASHRFRIPARVERQENRGPAAARNRGVELASGGRVAFLGDDTVPEPGWLAAHHRAFERRGGAPELAVFGYTGWHPRLKLDPFLRYINDHGLQFGYALIEDPDDVPFNFFYTSNLSLSRDLLLAEPFDLRFPYPAWEDIETGYRLKKRGLRLVYEPAARTAHDHPTTLRRFMSRQEKAGYSGVVFALLHPELAGYVGVGPGGPPPLPSPRLQRLREAVARLLLPLGFSTPRLWNDVLRFHYVRGLHRGWNERAKLEGGGPG